MAENLTYYDSPLTGEELDAAFRKIPQIDASVAAAAQSAELAESWTQGGTGSRTGENTNNARYWCNQAQTISQGALGWYESESALQSVHPTGQNGQWAFVGTTDTVWTWDSDTKQWIDSNKQPDMSQYYTKNQANATFVPVSGLLNLVYPVGSIYMSANNVSPQTFLGGTWQQIQGQFLLAASDSYPAGSTGGEAAHVLTIPEMPSHQHEIQYMASNEAGPEWAGQAGTCTTKTGTTGFVGGGQAHNNMPPYLAVYMWRRTA